MKVEESSAIADLPPVLYSRQENNLTATLGETVELRCTVLGYQPARHSVSWTRTTSSTQLPVALTFGTKVGTSPPGTFSQLGLLITSAPFIQ